MSNEQQLDFIHKVQYGLLCFFANIISGLGFHFVKHLGNFGGFLMWHFIKPRRNLAILNIQERLGYPFEEAKAIAKASFKQNTRSFLEMTIVHKFSYHPKTVTFTVNNPALLEEMRQASRPIVTSTAHIGAWEFLAAMIGDFYEGLPETKPRVMVVRRYPNPAVQKFIAKCRESHGAQMVGHRAIVPSVLKALKNKGIAGFLVDHNALSHEALYMPFLGRKAAVNMGPALLALRGEAMVYPICLVRTETGYAMEIEPALDTTTLEGTRDEKIQQITAFYTEAVEGWIRKYPTQWFWLHNRWKQVQLK